MNLVLMCKSYAGDLLRVERLADSLRRYNRDGLPFYICVPRKDVPLFSSRMTRLMADANVIADEEVIAANPRASLEHYVAWEGRKSQQVVKSEFWRWALREEAAQPFCYVCIDSESEFIREFGRDDFMHADGAPYTVMHLNESLLKMAARKGIRKVEENFRRDCALMKAVFGREGPDYSFAPTPVIWSSRVWQSLDEQWLQPQGITLWDAIGERPNELHWYGEALLKFRPIALHAIEPLFRVYHYNWEYYASQAMGETEANLRQRFLGILKQSSWEYELDAGETALRKPLASRMLRAVKRYLSRYR